MNKKNEIWNIPNTLTLFRIALIIPFLIFLFMDSWQAKLVSLIIFVLASITDFFDGLLARKLNQKTKFGNFMDPLADKLFVGAALIALPSLQQDLFPFWMVFLILSREFIITYLRIYAISREQEIKTLKMGKTKTTLQLFTIVTILVLLIIRSYIGTDMKGPLGMSIPVIFKNYFSNLETFIVYTPLLLMTITTFITVYSGILYIYKNRFLFLQEPDKKH